MQSEDAIDAIGERILRELEVNGRLPNLELAARVGLSPSACLRRVQDLERRGIIAGYRAVIDRRRMGYGLLVYLTVRLAVQNKRSHQEFERAMEAAPQVREVHNVTGTVEYLLRVETRDLADYKHFHTEVIGALPNVVQLVSHIVLSSPKDMRG